MSLRISCEAHEHEQIAVLIGHAGVANRRCWSLSAPDSAGADLDAQLCWILEQLTADLSVWATLVAEREVDLFVGLFLDQQNRGTGLSAASIAALAARGLSVGLDIYGPDESD